MNEQSAGQFKDHNFNGKGTYQHADGNKYVGDWVDNKMSGEGIFTWSNGDRYEKRCSQMSHHHRFHNEVFVEA